MAVEMRLPKARKPLSERLGRDSKKHLVVPGDTITTDTGFMRYVRIWGAQDLSRRLHSSLHVAYCPGTQASCLLVSKLPKYPGHILASTLAFSFPSLVLLSPLILGDPVSARVPPLTHGTRNFWVISLKQVFEPSLGGRTGKDWKQDLPYSTLKGQWALLAWSPPSVSPQPGFEAVMGVG